jgi:hypothetical protein
MVFSTGELVTFPASKLTGAAAKEWRKQHLNVSLKDSIASAMIVTKLSGTRRGYIVKLTGTEHELEVAARSIGTPEYMVGPACAEMLIQIAIKKM